VRLRNKGPQLHETVTNAETIWPITGKIDVPQMPLFYSQNDEEVVQDFLAKNQITRFAIIHAGARRKLRQWPKDRFAKAVDYLKNMYQLDIVFAGTQEDEADIEDIKKGLNFQTYNFTKGYHDAGVDLTLAVLNTSKHFVELDNLPIEVRELADIHLSYIDNRINPVDALKNLLFSKESYHVVRFISQDFERLLEKLCREKEFDVIVFESVFVAPYLDVVRKYSQAKCILRQYNVEYEIWQSLADIEKNPIKKWYLEVLSRRLKSFEVAQLNKFDGLTCVTQQDANVFNA
jgi:hypothetical protein